MKSAIHFINPNSDKVTEELLIKILAHAATSIYKLDKLKKKSVL